MPKNSLTVNSQPCERIDRVMDLVEGFETDEGLELLASVHWAVVKEPDKLRRWPGAVHPRLASQETSIFRTSNQPGTSCSVKKGWVVTEKSHSPM